MGWLKNYSRRFALLWKGQRYRQQLDEEMRLHIDLMIEENVGNGMSAKAARIAAMKRFGNMESFKEESRDAWGTRVFMDLIRDVHYSARSLWKSKGFSFAVILTLAICIGANTVILSTLYKLVFKPLPFEDPDRVVEVFNVDNRLDPKDYRAGLGQYIDFSENADLFEGFAIANPISKALGEGSDARSVMGYVVSANCFELFGIEPLAGRFFQPEELASGESNLLVLSESAWRRDYASSFSVLGERIEFSGESSYTVIGVAPMSMDALGGEPVFFVPYSMRKKFNPLARNFINVDMWARLKPGVTPSVGLSQLAALENRYLDEVAPPQHRINFEGLGHRVDISRPNPLKKPLALLQGGALFLLLVGCVNVLNLSLSRSRARLSELSVRYSLGVGMARLFRLTFVESLMLSVMAVVLGLFIARFGLIFANAYLPSIGVSSGSIEIGGVGLWWTTSFALLVALLLAILPMLGYFRNGTIQKLDTNSRSSTKTGSHFMGTGLVVSQFGIAFALIVGAVLLTKSLKKVMEVDPGFEAEKIIQARIALTPTYFRNRAESLSLRNLIVESLHEIPGVESVSLMMNEAVGESKAINLHIKGVDYMSNNDPLPSAIRQNVSADFFETMGISFLEGTSFVFDEEGECQDVLIDEVFARRYFGDPEASVGNLLAIDVEARRRLGPKQGWFRIAGVLTRANLEGLEARDGLPVIYRPYENGYWNRRGLTVLLRTNRSFEITLREAQAKLREIDPSLPVVNVSSLVDSLDGQLELRRGLAFLASCFGVVSLIIAGIGVYGMQAYEVSQRKREIGIRSAIGASPRAVLKMVLLKGLRKSTLGLGMGLLLSFYLARFLEDRLFDVSSSDPWTYGFSLVFLLIVSGIASYLPARRAVAVDPLEALGAE